MKKRIFLLTYDAGPDYVERRAPLRETHLALARDAISRGEILAAGALADPVDGSHFIFRCESADIVRDFAARDPYVRNGLIARWRVREWTPILGVFAEDGAAQ
jgi:hypothetical protein